MSKYDFGGLYFCVSIVICLPRLAPDIQEALPFLLRTLQGRVPDQLCTEPYPCSA